MNYEFSKDIFEGHLELGANRLFNFTKNKGKFCCKTIF